MHVVLVSPVTAFEPARSGPYLGLAVLASSLKTLGISCTCIDCNFLPTAYPLGLKNIDEDNEAKILEECLSYIVSCKPDVVGISTWGSSLPFTIVLAKALRQRLGNIPIVVGGLFYVPLVKQLMRYSENIDAVILGEAEVAFPEVLQRIRANRGFIGIKGVAYRENSVIHCDNEVNYLDAGSWGKPEFSSFINPLQLEFFFHYLEGSRGCTYQCIFCCMRGQGLRRKFPQRLVQEMAALRENKGVSRITLVDNFIPLQGAWIDDFCDLLIKRKLALNWSCFARADHITYPIVRKMAIAGCSRIHLGVESVSPDTLGYINKAPVILDYLYRLRGNIKAILDYGISLRISATIGFPYEGVGDMERTAEFALHLQGMGVTTAIGPVVVYPGSKMWDLYLDGKIELCKIKRPYLRTFLGGLFATDFQDDPWIAPQNFLPKHKFIGQEEYEEILSNCINAATL